MRLLIENKICLHITLGLMLVCFFPQVVYAQAVLGLPNPGTMLGLSPSHTPIMLKGLRIHPENPLQFDFLLDQGSGTFEPDDIAREGKNLIKYFLASLTIPEDDLWVNLSPFEENRIIPTEFGYTEMGRDLLAQDYILKQITASLVYPESELGQRFWDRIYQKAHQKYGTTDIPMNTFHKVWILPDRAVVHANGAMAYVIDSHLKVLLEEDYLATKEAAPSNIRPQLVADNQVQTNIIREIIIPEIEKEVNEGTHFAPLRQIYQAMILATWFKRNVRVQGFSLLHDRYIGQKKVAGVDVDDHRIKDKIYQQYIQAFKKGVYDYIKEDFDPGQQALIPRKYFSGGTHMKLVEGVSYQERNDTDSAMLARDEMADDFVIASVFDSNVQLKDSALDQAMLTDRKQQLITLYLSQVQENLQRFDQFNIVGLNQFIETAKLRMLDILRDNISREIKHLAQRMQADLAPEEKVEEFVRSKQKLDDWTRSMVALVAQERERLFKDSRQDAYPHIRALTSAVSKISAILLVDVIDEFKVGLSQEIIDQNKISRINDFFHDFDKRLDYISSESIFRVNHAENESLFKEIDALIEALKINSNRAKGRIYISDSSTKLVRFEDFKAENMALADSILALIGQLVADAAQRELLIRPLVTNLRNLKERLSIGLEQHLFQGVNDINSIIRGTWDFMRFSYGAESKINMEFNLTSQGAAFTDRAKMWDVFNNLIKNAIDAISDVGIIRIQTEDIIKKEQKYIRISVSDTGKGIAPTALEEIFQHGFTTKGADGQGIGLANVSEIITLHGGTIEVDSHIGDPNALTFQTTFTIDLPVQEDKLREFFQDMLQQLVQDGRLDVLVPRDRVIQQMETLNQGSYAKSARLIGASIPEEADVLISALKPEMLARVLEGLSGQIRNIEEGLGRTDAQLSAQVREHLQKVQAAFEQDQLALRGEQVEVVEFSQTLLVNRVGKIDRNIADFLGYTYEIEAGKSTTDAAMIGSDGIGNVGKDPRDIVTPKAEQGEKVDQARAVNLTPENVFRGDRVTLSPRAQLALKLDELARQGIINVQLSTVQIVEQLQRNPIIVQLAGAAGVQLPAEVDQLRQRVQEAERKVEPASESSNNLSDQRDGRQNPSDPKKQDPSEEGTTDPAQLTQKQDTVGGIDLSPEQLDLRETGEGMDILVPFDPEKFENVPIKGFTPVILNVVPVSHMPYLLGLVTEEDPLRLSRR